MCILTCHCDVRQKFINVHENLYFVKKICINKENIKKQHRAFLKKICISPNFNRQKSAYNQYEWQIQEGPGARETYLPLCETRRTEQVAARLQTYIFVILGTNLTLLEGGAHLTVQLILLLQATEGREKMIHMIMITYLSKGLKSKKRVDYFFLIKR